MSISGSSSVYIGNTALSHLKSSRFPAKEQESHPGLQLRRRSSSLGSVSELRSNFLLPNVENATLEELPYRTPWHQGWKNKTYNVFGHIMGQYKGALNPQAHGQNSFESERTFHGGDNVVIETFADGLLSSPVSAKKKSNEIG